MKQFNISNLFKTRPGFSKESFFAVNTCLLIFLFSIPSSSFAADSCRWVATANRPIASIVRDVTEKSGKAPVKSCGAGADFKVCHSCEDRLTEKQWRKIQLMLAEPSYRKWHQSWHSKSFTEAMKRAQESNGTLKANEIQGENFFYAHREMIRNVQANLAAEGLPCITPWTELPKDADDPIWPNTKALMFRKLKEKCDSLGEENILKIDTFNTELRIKRKEINDSRDTKERELDSIKDRTELFNRQEELWLESEEAVKKVKSELLLKHGLTDETMQILAFDARFRQRFEPVNF